MFYALLFARILAAYLLQHCTQDERLFFSFSAIEEGRCKKKIRGTVQGQKISPWVKRRTGTSDHGSCQCFAGH
jgi:hypothetical protein